MDDFSDGEDVNDYKVIKPIGRGSFSTVYLCRYQSAELRGALTYESAFMEEFFIIKEINLEVLLDKYRHTPTFTIVKRPVDSMNVQLTPYKHDTIVQGSEMGYYFNRLQGLVMGEIEVLRMMNHKNIVKFLDYFSSNHVFSLQMEYCEGGDLHGLLKSGYEIPISSFLEDISTAIEYIHDLNIIHRDIKPQNILLKGDTFKLTDFGFACYDGSAGLCSDDSESILGKKYYKICGTPFYMAPELLTTMGQKGMGPFYSKKVDIWSFGVCVFEVVSNCLPFLKRRVKSVKDLRAAFLDGGLQQDIWEDIDAKVDDPITRKLLKSMLNTNDTQRVDITGVIALAFPHTNNTTTQKSCTALTEDKSESSWVEVNESSSSLHGLNGKVGMGFLDWLKKVI